MENKNAKPGIEDLLFVWNHIHERFRRLQCYRNTEQPKKDLTPDQLEEREQEKGKPVLNLPARGENFHFLASIILDAECILTLLWSSGVEKKRRKNRHRDISITTSAGRLTF